MHLVTEPLDFTFLTPCFSGTVDGKDARSSELRVPPIRGHIRFWHRAAFGLQSANETWGSTAGVTGHGSKVAIRLLDDSLVSAESAPILPHKGPRERGARAALPAGTRALLELQRLPASADIDWNKAIQATKLWLVAGGLGYRSNRAAGSVWPIASWAPADRDALRELLSPLIAKNWRIAVAGQGKSLSADELRETASDTPRGSPHFFGNSRPRTPSPVRFKVVRLASELCLMILAPPGLALDVARASLMGKPDPRRWNDLGEWLGV